MRIRFTKYGLDEAIIPAGSVRGVIWNVGELRTDEFEDAVVDITLISELGKYTVQVSGDLAKHMVDNKDKERGKEYESDRLRVIKPKGNVLEYDLIYVGLFDPC